MTSKDSEANQEDHELIPEARVGAGLELTLGTGLELGPGPTLEANLGSQVRASSQSCYHDNQQGMCPHSPDELLPRKRVSFCDPDDVRGTIKEEVGCSTEPSMDDLEAWLEFQAGQLGTLRWWKELGAVPGIEDRHKFA